MNDPKRVNLALQGGGSHGAFTWGVLDALIEDGRLAFEAVSGTSAGAMVMVELDPSFRPGLPRTNAEVADRLNEITFGGALMAEMRAIAFVQDLMDKGAIAGEFGTRLKSIMVHSINDEASIAPMGSVSKFLIEPAYLEHLFQLGRLAAARWLASTFDDIGARSSVDIRARFL